MYSLHTTSRDLHFAIKESYHFECQPPVYFGLLNLWRHFADSLFFARIFSIVFILLSGLIINRICRISFGPETSNIITILFLLNPFVISISIDARLYSLLLFFSATSIYLFYKAYLTEYVKKINIGLHTAISLLSVFTQYLFVFLIIAQAIVLLQTKEWKKFRIFFIIHLFLALIFSINFIFIPDQMELAGNQARIGLEYFKAFGASVQSFFLPFNPLIFNSIGKRSFILLYFIWLLIFIKRQKFSLTAVYKIFEPIFFLFTITFVVFLSIILLFSTTKLLFNPRYLTILFPSLFVFFLFSLKIHGRKYFLLGFMFLLVDSLIANINTHSSLVFDRDYEKIAEFIKNNFKSDTPLLFYRYNHSLPFKYYYNGNSKIVQLPVPFDYNPGSGQSYIIEDTVTLNKIFKNDLRTWNKFIYITEKYDKRDSLRFNYGMIDKYLSDEFYVPLDTLIMGRAKTLGLRVRKLIRKEYPDNLEKTEPSSH
jgi:hypothetical protein